MVTDIPHPPAKNPGFRFFGLKIASNLYSYVFLRQHDHVVCNANTLFELNPEN
jgi:hypothetical protein